MQSPNKHVHSGNYYSVGLKRVLTKLTELGVPIALTAFRPPETPRTAARFTQIEHALMDWFDGRDYELAQSLIHYQPPSEHWCVTTVEDHKRRPDNLMDRVIAPSQVAALSGIILACDAAALKIDGCHKRGDSLVVMANGEKLATVEPITVEPFDVTARDRVREIFKGVRRLDQNAIKLRAARIPGFKGLHWNNSRASREAGHQFLGFPNAWAIAMRGALSQVEISVKLSQAQELVAAFFGAANWHQLVKHDDQLHAGMIPVGVAMKDENGVTRHKYYWTSEQAIYVVGKTLERQSVAHEVRHFGLSFSSQFHLAFALAPMAAATRGLDASSEIAPTIECPSADYWTDLGDSVKAERAAANLLKRIESAKDDSEAETTTRKVLYSGSDALDVVRGILNRDGLPTDNIVVAENCVCAVEYKSGGVDNVGRVSVLHIFEHTTNGLRRADPISMYKAESAIVESSTGYALSLKADYGRDDAVEVLFNDIGQLNHLLSLTHASDLFSLVARPELTSPCV